MNDKSSLVLVGSGIKFISHLTTEARAYIQQSDIVLYLVNDPAMKQWIHDNNANTQSLDNLYNRSLLRIDCYREITDFIVQTVKKSLHVCVVLYGHPSIFSQPGLNAVTQASKEGFYTKVLPGISADACMFADLLIDTGSCGYQSFETTDFLLHRRKFDPSSHLLLWQIDSIGALDHAQNHNNDLGINILTDCLREHYASEHKVIIYEAAQYPSFDPLVIKLPLSELPNAKVSPISTLYIPPVSRSSYDKNVAIRLGMNLSDLEK